LQQVFERTWRELLERVDRVFLLMGAFFAAPMSHLVVRDLSKRFADGTVGLDGVGFEVCAGELMVVLGASGSGKTTLLRLIAGLDEPTGGTILLGSQDVTRLPPHKRGAALVFQDVALYPHLTVEQNLAFSLRHGGRRSERPSADQTEARVQEIADLLGLTSLLRKFPDELSGGQQQRVALGRALVRRPTALLLDEPFSNLDAPLRRTLRHELRALKPRLGIPIVYVTHDADEAMLLGDRMAVLDRGKLLQCGTPEEVYNKPINKSVACLFGLEGMNFLPGRMVPQADEVVFEADGWRLPLPGRGAAGPVEQVCGFWPESLRVGRGRLEGQVCEVETAGHNVFVHCRLPGEARSCTAVVGLWDPQRSMSPPRLGELVALHLELDEVQWFDPVSGQRLDAGGAPVGAGSAWHGVSVFPSQA
jgi:ABC-type sugar transport system ATPase subunit